MPDIQDSNVNFFDNLVEEFDTVHGHTVYALDNTNKVKYFVSINEFCINISNSFDTKLNSKFWILRIKVDNSTWLTLREKFNSEQLLKEREDYYYKLIKDLDFKENSIQSPTSKYNR